MGFEFPKTVDDINCDQWYATNHLSKLIFPDGRRMDEALRNHPLAPQHTDKGRVGKYYTGLQILNFYNSVCKNAFCQNDLNEKLFRASLELAEARQIATDAQKAQEQIRDSMASLCSQVEKHNDQIGAMVDVFSRAIRHYNNKDAPLSRVMSSGVYFLFSGDNLVYVGQAVRILARVGQHYDKNFDRFSFVNCAREHLNDVEGFFIKLLNPKLNRTSTGVMRGPSSCIMSFDNLISRLDFTD
jgi:hypothetical protein